MPLDALRRIPRKVLISGGLDKLEIIHATLKALGPGVFITDETTAQALLEDGGD
jgi:DNA-binding transcriptional regulator LsrR (DeoR family)